MLRGLLFLIPLVCIFLSYELFFTTEDTEFHRVFFLPLMKGARGMLTPKGLHQH